MTRPNRAEVLQFLGSRINYGGRVTDKKDKVGDAEQNLVFTWGWLKSYDAIFVWMNIHDYQSVSF